MLKSLVLAVAGLSLLFIAESNAAELVTPPAGGAPPPAATPPTSATPGTPGNPPLAPGGGAMAAMSYIPPSGPPILLEIGKGTLIRLPRAASTVFIANPDVADVQVKSPALIYLSAKAPGETVIYAVDANDNVLLHAPVRVEQDLSRLRQSIHSLMPGEDIAVSSVDGSLVLSGNVSTASRAEKARALAAALAGDPKTSSVVNQLNVETPNQVNLRVRIAEVDRNVLKALGFNWTSTPAAGTTGLLGFNTQNPITSQNITQTNTITYGFGLPGSSAKLQVTLDALAQEGLITTLAEPNLTALNGQTASFLAGGEFPVPIAVAPPSGGVATITVDFKTFGVSLDFTPTILDANHLNLKIRPEVSELTSTGSVQISGFTIPALTVRRAETTVELGSGESFALAGLLQNNTSQNVSKVPWLGDVPILGQLFRSDQFQRNETELVIIITPYLVRPSAVALAAPTDGYVAPHDVQRVINSETYRQTLPGPQRGPVEPGNQGLIGPVGFRMD
jgi:pilus assembly protein CpaC